MTSFDFAGALASGATPQAITQYLTSQGAGNLASTYFNQQPAQSSSFQDALNSLKGFAASVASPITTAAATGVRAIEATPKVAAAVGDAITGNTQKAGANMQAAKQTMATPAFGQNTVEGNTPQQNVGEAIQAASLLVPGMEGEGPVANIAKAGTTGALGAGGNALTDPNATAGSVAKATGIGAAAGAAIGGAAEGLPALAKANTFAAEDANAGTSALHIPDQNIYAKITPEQQNFLSNETANIPFEGTDRPHLTPLSSLEDSSKTTAQRVTLDDLKQASPNAKAALDKFDTQAQAKPTGTAESSQQVAARALQNPLSKTEQEQAAAQGRTTMVNGKPTIADSPRDVAMQKALQPLVENGDVTANVDKTTKLVNGDEQLSNIDNVNTAIKNQGTQISEGVGTQNKPYSPQDLNKALFKTEVPSSIKPTDEKVTNLQNAVFKIVQDNTKDTQGLLKVRQEFDALVKKDYPHLYEQGMSPTKQYIGNLRETLNDFTAKQLPEGKLPNGVGFRDALQNQHQLINAREEMTQKFVREYPQGSTNFSRFTKAHPQSRYLSRFFERRGLYEVLKGATTVGGGALLGKAISKK